MIGLHPAAQWGDLPMPSGFRYSGPLRRELELGRPEAVVSWKLRDNELNCGRDLEGEVGTLLGWLLR